MTMQITSKINSIVSILFILGAFMYGFVPYGMETPVQSHNASMASLSVIILYVILTKKYRSKYNIFIILILLFIAYLIVVGSMMSVGKMSILFVFSIMFAQIVANAIHYSDDFKTRFLAALKLLILLSIFLLLLQLIGKIITGQVMNIHNFFYPLSESRVTGLTGLGDVYRIGAMHGEPGTFANITYILLILYMVLSKKNTSLVLFVGALSIVISGSLWGIMFGMYMLVILLIAKLLKTKDISVTKIFFLYIFIISISSVGIYNFLQSSEFNYAKVKLSSNTQSVRVKDMAYDKYKKSYDDFMFVGQGFTPEFNTGIPSVQDAGLLLNMTVVFGILPTIFLMIIFLISLLRCCSWVELFAFLPILVSKIYYIDRIFWLLFFLVIYGTYKSTRKLLDNK